MRALPVSFALLTLLSSPVPFSHSQARAQDPPIEWGKIPAEHLAMTSYAPDTSAPAVILADFGESFLDDELDVVFKRHLRIKILRTAGFDWGTHAITLYTKDDYEEIDDIEGATYSSGPGGAPVVTELESDDIFEEKVDADRTRYRLTLPALTPGCVIEVRYLIRKNSWFSMRTWYFQSSIPTLWSEYRAIIPPALAYAVSTVAFSRFHVNETGEVLRAFGGRAQSYLHDRSITCRQYRLVMKDVPALRDEPFITTMDDYVASVGFQLAEYAVPSGGTTKVLKTWGELVEEMLKSDSFGDHLKPDSDVDALTARVTANCATAEEKMRAIYDFVRTTITWDQRHRVYADLTSEKLLETKKGSSAEINFLLLAMLRSAKIDADPVMISTRENGRITELYPLANQFNSLLVRAKPGGMTRYLSAINPLRPFWLLPSSVLNVRGIVIRPGPVEWVTIPATKKGIHSSFAKMTLTEEGDLRGTLESVDEEYAALTNRNSLKEKKPMEIARTAFDAERVGFTLDSVQILGADSLERSLTIRAVASVPAYAQSAGEHLYLTPMILDRTMSSPFKSKVREFPVDMGYGRNYTMTTAIVIPEGYEVKDLPQNVQFGVGDASYLRRISFENGILTSTFTFVVNSPVFQPAKYTVLREFFERIVATEAEQVVLQKKPVVQKAKPASPPPKPGIKGGKR